MDEDDYQKLLDIVTNEETNTILHTSLQDITIRKENLLKELYLSNEYKNELLLKLKHYRYVMELPDLEIGNYIRWINLNNGDNIYLTNGSFISNIMILEDGIQIRCTNRFGKIHQLKFDENLIFQKLTEQEHILLQLVECVKTNKIKC
mgnify:FL=1|tara:strand:+ start:800 stop:1243 length:444 start_codon:yes stop_codon:yes gene_type:complete